MACRLKRGHILLVVMVMMLLLGLGSAVAFATGGYCDTQYISGIQVCINHCTNGGTCSGPPGPCNPCVGGSGSGC